MSTAREVAHFVRRKVRELDRIDGSGDGNARARADLALLRRGLGRGPADLPAVWAITLADAPEEVSPSTHIASEPTRAEWAVHIALSLYALHRQGKGESMNADPVPGADGAAADAGRARGPSFGAALGALRRDPSKEPGIIRRFHAVVTADDLAELSRHILGVVQMLRAADRPIKLDYPAFAADMFWYQFPEHRAKVIMKWGRDFWRHAAPAADSRTASVSEVSTTVQEK